MFTSSRPHSTKAAYFGTKLPDWFPGHEKKALIYCYSDADHGRENSLGEPVDVFAAFVSRSAESFFHELFVEILQRVVFVFYLGQLPFGSQVCRSAS